MVKKIEIKKNTTLAHIWDLYKNLFDDIGSYQTIEISLPKKLDYLFFSLNIEVIQFVSTVFKTSKLHLIQIDVDSNNADEMNSLYNQEYVFPIVSLLWNEVDFKDKNDLSIKPILREYQNLFIKKMRASEAMKGDKILLMNLDHFSEDRGVLRLFEANGEYNPNEYSFKNAIERIIKDEVLKFSTKNQYQFEFIKDDISSIIYELMKNTFEWARHDLSGKLINPSIRGVYFKFHKYGVNNILKEYESITPIHDYFSDSTIDTNKKGEVYFVEISVFDSGVGFVELNKEDLSDVDIIKKCLIKNQTSSTSNIKQKKGLGLDRILNILDKKGLFKVNTDNYSLYRNLRLDNYNEKASLHDLSSVILKDWKTSSIKDIQPNTFKYSGTAISILYPFTQKK
jgi:hypothetical protein